MFQAWRLRVNGNDNVNFIHFFNSRSKPSNRATPGTGAAIVVVVTATATPTAAVAVATAAAAAAAAATIATTADVAAVSLA
uniref:Uncharacterized protein n=1 Tax=Vespula pensylvanica TaxID=30213 RepID=A0A834P0F2_VESPE|nr:hypothetical protein H0235_008583 [Vespula pensylvanica]